MLHLQHSTIGDCCEVIAGQSPEGKYYNSDGKGMPFYQGKKDFGEKFLEEPSIWTTETPKVARKSDILMSVRAPVGPVNIATQDVCIGRGLAAIRSRGTLEIDFLFYQLLHLQPKIAGKEGAVFASINKSEIAALPIVVGPLSEQRRIVAILDEAFEDIATAKSNAEKNLQNARELFENYHQSVFSRGGEGWFDYRLGQIASFRNGINYTKQSKGRSVPIIGVKNFQDHLWAPLDDLDSVTLDGELSELDTLAEGDILSVRSNGNPELIGRCMLVGSLSEPTTHSGFTIRIRLHHGNALPQYVCQFLKSRDVRRTLIDGGNGANIRSLNQGTLSSVVIPLPPIEVQQRLIHEIEAIHSKTAYLAEIASRKLTAIDELKNSLLHQAFTGRL